MITKIKTIGLLLTLALLAFPACNSFSKTKTLEQEMKECNGTDRSYSTLDMERCTGIETMMLDEELQKAIVKAHTITKKWDQSDPGYYLEKRFDLSQAAYKKYEEAQCSFARSLARDGSKAPLDEAGCSNGLRRERLKIIQYSLDQLPN